LRRRAAFGIEVFGVSGMSVSDIPETTERSRNMLIERAADSQAAAKVSDAAKIY